ncbi:MAG TPA: hypothetical protein VEX12_03855 [Microbacterium sp.]|nr:hypothetical protein [Microbacterium sp.]
MRGGVDLALGFAMVEQGAVKVSTASGTDVRVVRGATVAVPHAAGAITVSGNGTVMVCRPPRPAQM